MFNFLAVWSKTLCFIVLLSFVSFGVFQKMNSRDVSKVSSVISDKSEDVLDIKLASAISLNNHDLPATIKRKKTINNYIQ